MEIGLKHEERSAAMFARARNVIPGGVNSPVRACINVGCDPLFIDHADGGTITSVDGDTFVDFVNSWGPMLLGHNRPEVTAAVVAAASRGTSYGAPCPAELTLAELVVDAFPAMDMVRMVNSGTEATMSALRLARGVTGRDKVVKFIGCYHGHADPFLASAGSGVATLSIPGTPGVPAGTVADTLLAVYNDLGSVERLLEAHAGEVAAVIVEPAAGNMGLVLPEPGFLDGLRALCDAHGALLIFDEVITGFRAAYGGMQTRTGVEPDLTTLGKIIGGGLPVGAYGGRRVFMSRVAPAGDIYQAGTLSGNPLAMAAGIATLEILRKADYAGLEARVERLCQGVEAICATKGVPVRVHRLGSMFTIFFTDGDVADFSDVMRCDAAAYGRFFKRMRANGMFIAPSPFEVSMAGFAHTDEHFAMYLDAVERSL